MATTKLGTTKSASRAINYAEKRAAVKSGYNLDADYAKSQLKATRALYDKEDGIQAHTIIQSFRPGETTPEQANEIGLELAKEVAAGHQLAVYTHADTNHIHNHIVIGSINLENGKKYHSNAQQRHFVKETNDAICQQHGLSVVKEKNAAVRHTLAEQELLKKDQIPWKEEIRQAINYAKEEADDFNSFKKHLEADYGIEVKLRGNTLSFKHPDRQRFVRANKLGDAYEKEAIDREFTRQAAREKTGGKPIDWEEYERRNQLQSKTSRSRVSSRTDSPTNRPASRKYRAEQQRAEREYETSAAAEQTGKQTTQRKNQRSKEQSRGLSR